MGLSLFNAEKNVAKNHHLSNQTMTRIITVMMIIKGLLLTNISESTYKAQELVPL